MLPGGLAPRLCRPGYVPLKRYPPAPPKDPKAAAKHKLGQAQLRAWFLDDMETVVDATKPGSYFPASVPYHPWIVRLAQVWRRPVHEVERDTSPWDVLDAWDGILWLHDVDCPPTPRT